ncbi:MAG: hypothetical protein ACJ74Z_11275 [Bryobacteraceae bacterium]
MQLKLDRARRGWSGGDQLEPLVQGNERDVVIDRAVALKGELLTISPSERLLNGSRRVLWTRWMKGR